MRRLAVTVAAAAAVAAMTVPAAQAAIAAPGGSQPATVHSHSSYTLPAGYADPCPAPAAGKAGCAALAGPRSGHASGTAARAATATTATWPGYAPSDLQTAYNLPSTASGSLVTVAVVTPYHDPDAASDLAAYRSNYSLSPCTVADGCFSQVNQTGATTPAPPENSAFTTATSVSLDMISATCPNCHLLLVEANSTGLSDLGTAEDEAVTLGANVIDNPWTIAEASLGSTETSYDQYFDHPGVAITAPAGDAGYGVNYPAASQYVTAVGGTTLAPDSTSSTGYDESAWADTGSGCSAYEPKPSWQTDPDCGQRMLNDVSAIADPQYPVAYYDTPFAGGNSTIGGTDVAAAVVAGIYGLAGVPAAGTNPASYPYLHPGGSYTTPGNAYPYADGLTGIGGGYSNGTCAVAYWCTPGAGYSGPAGLGSPATDLAFTGSGGDTGSVYNSLGNFCLDDTGGSTTNGNPVQIFTCSGNAEQKWTYEPNGTVQWSSGHCLDVLNAGTKALTTVVLAATCATTNAGVDWIPHGRTLVNPNSGMCLYAPTGTSGTKLEIDGCSASRTESFLQPFSDPTATGLIVSDLSSSVCLYDLNGGTAGGTAIQIIGCNPASRADNFVVGTDGSLQVEGGCIGPASGGTANGTAITLGGCDGGQSEHWIIKSDGSLWNIPTDGSCLDDTNASTANNNPTQLYSCSGNPNQLWNLP
ncbi:MAG TPA: ricin-type beta-trefoil lectin domain protein [Trebonia sp.]|nr:ricin-type beta-trefoil lectin domain protein [Trebonia sp.]